MADTEIALGELPLPEYEGPLELNKEQYMRLVKEYVYLIEDSEMTDQNMNKAKAIGILLRAVE